MTPKEAIEILDAIARRNVFCTLEAGPISAFELAHIALEKQTPKKPYISKEEYTTNINAQYADADSYQKLTANMLRDLFTSTATYADRLSTGI